MKLDYIVFDEFHRAGAESWGNRRAELTGRLFMHFDPYFVRCKPDMGDELSMNNNLLIVGAGIYGAVAEEIAESMGCFGKIGFVDDNAKTTANGKDVVGTTDDLDKLAREYSSIIVAIGNPDVRLSLLRRIEETTPLMIATLISPRAYVSPSAQIMKGSIIEPMAAVHTRAVISCGCIISAGAVVNHAAVCRDGVHVDCNATVAGMTTVPDGTKVKSGEVFR